jgi:hypothetical protein
MGLRKQFWAFALFAGVAGLLALSIDAAQATVLPATSAAVDARAAANLPLRSARHRKGVRKHMQRRHRAGIHRAAKHRAAKHRAAKHRAARHRAGLRRTAKHRACRRHRKCRRRSASLEAYAARQQAPVVAAPAPLPAPIVDHTLDLPVRDEDADIIEREKDIPIILSVATTLRGYSVEHAVSIVEVRDPVTGYMTHKLVQGDARKRTRDSAELAQLTLAPNERLIADLHSHPLVRADSRDFTEIAMARKATRANFYPGLEDYAAIIKRGVVSAIVDPDGGVILLRRINGAPSIRKIDGEPLEALDEAGAARLEVAYLYTQGYLAGGDWVRPAVAVSLHAGP